MKKTKKKYKLRRVSKLTVLIILLDIIVIDGLILINTNFFKSFWIPTAMTTKSHGYLAFTLYDEDVVYKVLSENYIEENTETMNLDDIVIGGSENTHYASKYEKELFTRDPGNDVYKTIRIIEPRYKGWLIAVYDTNDVTLAVSSKLGKIGQSVNTLVKNNDGLVGINGGGFEDLDGWGNGSVPYGAIIHGGELVWNHAGGSGGLIALTKDHKLYLTDDGLLFSMLHKSTQSLATDENLKETMYENHMAKTLVEAGYPLYYYQSEGKAEVNFVVQNRMGQIIPIEIIAKSNSKAKSLSVFMKNHKVEEGYRITENNFQTKKDIRYIPIYAAFCLNTMKM